MVDVIIEMASGWCGDMRERVARMFLVRCLVKESFALSIFRK